MRIAIIPNKKEEKKNTHKYKKKGHERFSEKHIVSVNNQRRETICIYI